MKGRRAMQMATLVLNTKDQDPVAVNPQLIRCVTAMKNGGSWIHFDGEHRIAVAMEFATLVEFLRSQ